LTLTQTLALLLPEVILCAAGLVILGLDLIWQEESKKGWLPYLAVLGPLTALGAVLSLRATSEPLLGGMFALDAFALFFKILATVSTALVMLLAIPYFKGRTPYRIEFFGLLCFALLAMSLAVSAADLIMIYLAMEFLSLISYVLTGYLREDVKSSEAAIKYFLYGAVASGAMLYGMSLLYGATGTTSLSGMAGFLAAGSMSEATWLMLPAAILLLAGFGFKIALVPFHQWSPDTYEGAPTPVTAFLSVGPKATGFAILVRVFLTALSGLQADWIAILAGVSMVTMSVGNLIALRQSNIKRLLAYSSIAQAGYILIGLVSLAATARSQFTGVNGLLLYLFGYLFTNLGVFTAVVAFEHATGSNEIADYAGLWRRAPAMAGLMVVFFLSLAGIPPTAGFVGKLFVFGAAIQRQFYVLALVGVINSVISVFYYFNVVRHMFFLPPPEGSSAVRLPWTISLPLVITGVMTLAIGVYPQPFIDLATYSVQIAMH